MAIFGIAYWQIRKMIVEKQGGEVRANYGDGLVKELSVQLTKDFGKGFDESSLRRMRQFYILFPKRATVWRELSWNHYHFDRQINDRKNMLIPKNSRIDVIICH